MNCSQENWSQMSDADLTIAAFGEGTPPEPPCVKEEERPRVITISMDSENTQMPFGIVKNGPFLELFWRNTGADCDGEEALMQLPDGYTYLIRLVTQVAGEHSVSGRPSWLAVLRCWGCCGSG